MSEQERLLPCPLCGCEAELDTLRAYASLQYPHRVRDQVAIYCLACGLDLSHDPREGDYLRDDLMRELVNKWNTRSDAALTAARAEIERLREALKPLAFCDERQPPYGVELDDWTPAVERARAVLSAIEAELGRE